MCVVLLSFVGPGEGSLLRVEGSSSSSSDVCDGGVGSVCPVWAGESRVTGVVGTSVVVRCTPVGFIGTTLTVDP